MLEFRTETDFNTYALLIKELTPALGGRFPKSMENWCGLNERPYPLPVWHVYQLYDDNTLVGLCSYYRQEEDPSFKYWIGWFGVRLPYRRQGYGRAMLSFLKNEIVLREGTELWVYIDTENAEQFYASFGFQRSGVFSEANVPQAAASDNDILMRLTID